jgi:integrase
VYGSKRQVEKQAESFYREVSESEERVTVPTIRKGLTDSISLSGMNETSRNHSRLWANQFIDWIGANHPQVKTWEDMRRSVLDHYVRTLEERRIGTDEDQPLAFDTIRLAIRPVMAAWKRAHLDYPDEVFPPSSPKISARRKSKPDCLQASESAAMLDHFEKSGSPLFPVVVLQTLAGLRVLEASAVRVSDIDFERGVLAVVTTPRHTLKTESSERTIPLCREALDRLRSWVGSQNVTPITGEISAARTGKPWDRHSLRKEWVRVRDLSIAESKKQEEQSPSFWRLPPKRLRSAFATMAARMKAPDRELKRYLGHEAGDVMGDHYRVISVEELRSVSDRMNEWRTLPDIGEGWQKVGVSKKKTAI